MCVVVSQEVQDVGRFPIYIASRRLLAFIAKMHQLPAWIHHFFYDLFGAQLGDGLFCTCHYAHALQIQLCCQYLPNHSSECFLAVSRVHQCANTQHMQSADPDVYLGRWQRADLVIWLCYILS